MTLDSVSSSFFLSIARSYICSDGERAKDLRKQSTYANEVLLHTATVIHRQRKIYKLPYIPDPVYASRISDASSALR